MESQRIGSEGMSASTLRIDIKHTGSADSESFELDETIVEGPWPGGRLHGNASLEYGPYRLEVHDIETRRLIYSSGFASIFGEWRTTAEARDTTLTFHESVRVPKPERPAQLAIIKQDASSEDQILWETVIDPASARTPPPGSGHMVWTILENGPAVEKVDILFLGDGYTAEEMQKWHHDALRLTDTLFSYEPFRSRRDAFNVRAIDTPSKASGIRDPLRDIDHETPIGATYDAFGMERYILSFANKQWRDVAGAAPYEFVVIIVNDSKYGGAGIYNLFETVSADNAFTSYVLVHEFGHHFAGLGDEYYTSDVTYELDVNRPEPWAPNLTADPLHPKWKDLVNDSTPLPTPWPKAEYEAIREESGSGADKRRTVSNLLQDAEYANVVGAFEGANYASTGYYRPEVDCIMFTRTAHRFCKVCTRALNRMIDAYSGPLEPAK